MKNIKLFALIMLTMVVALTALTSCGEDHVHEYADATCTTPKTCSCGATEGEALGHTFVNGQCACGAEDPNYASPHEHNYISTVTAPTCTEAGYTTYACSCGDSYTDNAVAATGHDYVNATCTAPKTCSVCGATEGEALGHTFVNGQCACGVKDPDYQQPQIDLPDDYVITMADMERFLATKNEQYPITNEYVELYQQESGGYIANALKAGLVVDKAQHLPSQKWHYFESWLYPTIEEGMTWDASASSRSYGNFSCPELLLWIIEATGVDSAKVEEAKNIAIAGKEAGTKVQTICANIRAAVPFNTYLRPLIIDFLENNPVGYESYTLTVNSDSAYELAGIKNQYLERETVTFTILISDNTKEVAKVTVNGKILGASSGTTYKFTMPSEDVEVVITLKDKEVTPPPTQATKDYYYDVVYELPGKSAVGFDDPAEADAVLQFNGKQEDIISSVSNITYVYGGGRGGSGDNIWYAGNMLKLGTTSVTGSITLELTQNVTGVIITGYVTNENCNIRVGDSDSTIWSGNGDDGKTTSVTAKGDYAMNIAGKDTVGAGATSTIQINFESTDSITISTEKSGSKYYVLYITAIEFIVDETA